VWCGSCVQVLDAGVACVGAAGAERGGVLATFFEQPGFRCNRVLMSPNYNSGQGTLGNIHIATKNEAAAVGGERHISHRG